MGTPLDTITVSKERRKLWNPLNAILDTPAFSQYLSIILPNPFDSLRYGAFTVTKTSGISHLGRQSRI